MLRLQARHMRFLFHLDCRNRLHMLVDLSLQEIVQRVCARQLFVQFNGMCFLLGLDRFDGIHMLIDLGNRRGQLAMQLGDMRILFHFDRFDETSVFGNLR